MKFLVIDDDEAIHLYLKDILCPYARVDSALDGPAALRLFEQSLLDLDGRYDAVFLDILMPGMDGHAVAARLRQMERDAAVTADSKLVMITALADTRNVSKAFFKGLASCYLVKPFDRAKILGELRNNRILP